MKTLLILTLMMILSLRRKKDFPHKHVKMHRPCCDKIFREIVLRIFCQTHSKNFQCQYVQYFFFGFVLAVSVVVVRSVRHIS
jgi:hypothetical protein